MFPNYSLDARFFIGRRFLLQAQSSALLAALLIILLSACNKAETSSTNATDNLATKTDEVAPASSPPPQVVTEKRRVTGIATPRKDKADIKATPKMAQNPIPKDIAPVNIAPTVVQKPDKDGHAPQKSAAVVTQKPVGANTNGASDSQNSLPIERVELADGSIGNPIAGKEKSQLCQGCHGEEGISLEPLIPNLAGQYGKYIIKQIHDYQTGARKHQIMNAMAKTVSDSELADIAAYFTSQSKMKGDGSGDSIGENLFLNGNSSVTLVACIKCHGVKGKGLTPKTSLFPVIGGQHKEYLRKQLMDFRGKIRLNSPGRIMNNITGSLTDAEIDALADYVSAQ